MRKLLLSLSVLITLSACGGGSGGGSAPPNNTVNGDDARRAVLADLGAFVILPSLQTFATQAADLSTKVSAYAADVSDAAAKTIAQQAWVEAIRAFQRIEALQLGPAGRSGEVDGGQDLRDFIYAYPQRNVCVIDRAAYAGDSVDANTRIDASGLGALEYLLFNEATNSNCEPDAGVDVAQSRADYAQAVAAFVSQQANALQQAWAADGGNFADAWATAGAGSAVYSRPQDALDALSTALFYVEKESKDRKIACPTGIGASGLVCTGNDVSRVEFPYARESLLALRANVQVFRDAFTGLSGQRGLNDLLIGIDRQDIADKLVQQLDAVLAQLDGPLATGFEPAIESISSNDDCINAASAKQGEPAACALHGLIKDAMDTFRAEVVASLSLATPANAAGDND